VSPVKAETVKRSADSQILEAAGSPITESDLENMSPKVREELVVEAWVKTSSMDPDDFLVE